MFSIDEVRLGLDNQDWALSDGLQKLDEYSKYHGLTDLATWASCELRGYPGVNEDVTAYRRVVGLWKNPYGQTVTLLASHAVEMGRIPILQGIVDIEPYVDTGLQLQLPLVTAQYNAVTGSNLYGADVDGKELQALLKRVRVEARRRLNQAVARVPGRSLNYPAPNFVALVPDVELAAILGRRWNEANYSFAAAAYLSTVIMLGSILEGVLLSKVQQDLAKSCSSKAAPKDKVGKVLPTQDWKLQSLIDVSHECGWLKKQDKDLSHTIRDYRNYVHPNKELQEGTTFDANTCRIIFEVVTAALS